MRRVTRPNVRFVEIKTCEQQGTLVLHRVRLMLMRQRVQLSRNAIRGHISRVRPGGSGRPRWPSAIDHDPGQPG